MVAVLLHAFTSALRDTPSSSDAEKGGLEELPASSTASASADELISLALVSMSSVHRPISAGFTLSSMPRKDQNIMEHAIFAIAIFAAELVTSVHVVRDPGSGYGYGTNRIWEGSYSAVTLEKSHSTVELSSPQLTHRNVLLHENKKTS